MYVYQLILYVQNIRIKSKLLASNRLLFCGCANGIISLVDENMSGKSWIMYEYSVKRRVEQRARPIFALGSP